MKNEKITREQIMMCFHKFLSEDLYKDKSFIKNVQETDKFENLGIDSIELIMFECEVERTFSVTIELLTDSWKTVEDCISEAYVKVNNYKNMPNVKIQ